LSNVDLWKEIADIGKEAVKKLKDATFAIEASAAKQNL
jgi:hypothetical protein